LSIHPHTPTRTTPSGTLRTSHRQLILANCNFPKSARCARGSQKTKTIARPPPPQHHHDPRLNVWLTQGPIPEPPQRAILRAPNSVPPQPIHKYDLRSRRGALSAKRIRRNYREHRRAFVAVLVLPIPEAYILPTHTFQSAKNGPDRLVWERAEADKLIRLMHHTIFS
jgi:hypothetical protein